MSIREKRRRVTGLLLVALILLGCMSPQFRTFVAFPDHIRLPQGQAQDISLGIPIPVTVSADRPDRLAALGGDALSLTALRTGRATVDLRLFGLIPLRHLTVDVVAPVRLVPGGHSIGVLLRSQGVMIVGFAAVRDEQGTLHQPAREAGMEMGDAIVAIGGKEVRSEEQASQLFEEAGRMGTSVQITIKRKGRLLEKDVTPVREKETGRWRVGLYIRDGAAGVGTLTFYDPTSGRFGALGHVIADGETAQPIEIREGHIVTAVVTAVEKGKKGSPGEKIGTMQGHASWLGTIDRNTRFGIFGRLHSPIENALFPEALPVAMADQVKEGPAEIITVVEGQKLERFEIEILRVMRQPTAEGKNMIVKITDPRLLARTGGIVQGMSGSPIIQDGRIVGAVTHVFVNDPTRGYGALIEWMLQEGGIVPEVPQTSLREALPPGGSASGPFSSGDERYNDRHGRVYPV